MPPMATPVPNSQATDMWAALKGQFPALVVDKYIMHYRSPDFPIHAYLYWHAANNADNNTDGNECVKQEVIDFLKAHP